LGAIGVLMTRHQARALRALCAGLLLAHAGSMHAEMSPVGAGLSSLLIPGAGQFANGDNEAAAAHFGVFAVSVYGLFYYRSRPDYLDEDRRYDDVANREFINRTTLKYDYAARLATDSALYSSYGAYRDARRRSSASDRTPVPTESLGELARAPFTPQYFARPTTFIPLALQAWAAFRSKDGYGIYRAPDVSVRDLHLFNASANEMTAVGEEAFFRGFLNNEFSNRYGDGVGLGLSSTVFGLAHTGQGQTANAWQAAVAGLYLGWVHQRNGFEAGEGVAIHYWINVLAGISAIRNGGSAQLITLGTTF
jgi:membrane protease YdiL (CAAX protease family)